MTEKQLARIIETLGLIDLGDAILYLDEKGYLEAAFSTGPLEHDSNGNSSLFAGTDEQECA